MEAAEGHSVISLSKFSFAYLKIPIKDPIDRFQFQSTTKLVSSNSLFPITFLAREPFLI